MFDVEPFNQGEPAVVTVTLEDRRRPDAADQPFTVPDEALEGALATGMVGGAIESWNRLETEDRLDLTEPSRQIGRPPGHQARRFLV